MDGFDPSVGVIVIAATNRRELLDPALLRPGRFDRHVVVQPPDTVGRRKILAVHTGQRRWPTMSTSTAWPPPRRGWWVPSWPTSSTRRR